MKATFTPAVAVAVAVAVADAVAGFLRLRVTDTVTFTFPCYNLQLPAAKTPQPHARVIQASWTEDPDRSMFSLCRNICVMQQRLLWYNPR